MKTKTEEIQEKIFKKLKGKCPGRVKKILCGQLIGSGTYRDVYLFKGFPNYVIKIERDMGEANFANATEFRHYIDNKEWKFMAQWLAPCIAISETSQVMVQERVSWDGKQKHDYPKRIPAFFTDTKYKNFGWIGNRFVCCDYSFIPFYIIKEGNSKLKKVKWWGPYRA